MTDREGWTGGLRGFGVFEMADGGTKQSGFPNKSEFMLVCWLCCYYNYNISDTSDNRFQFSFLQSEPFPTQPTSISCRYTAQTPEMKKPSTLPRLLCLAVALAWTHGAQASTVFWGSEFNDNLFDSSGNILDATYSFEIGTFTGGFTPTCYEGSVKGVLLFSLSFVFLGLLRRVIRLVLSVCC